MSKQGTINIDGINLSTDDFSAVMEMCYATTRLKAMFDSLSDEAITYLNNSRSEMHRFAGGIDKNTKKAIAALSDEFGKQNIALPGADDNEKAMMLRSQASDLLEQANAIDNMFPVLVTHSHEYGSSGYVLWVNDHDQLDADEENGCQKIIETIGLNFDEGWESLMVETTVGINELTGSNAGRALRFEARPALAAAASRKIRPA